MKFSQRQGHVTPRLEIQLAAVDEPLRSALWNCFVIIFLDQFEGPDHAELILLTMEPHSRSRQFALGTLETLYRALWSELLAQPMDTLPNNYDSATSKIRAWFFSAQWFEVYDFTELVATTTLSAQASQFKTCCNKALERELSAYRFVGDQISPVVDPAEISEVETALRTSEARNLTGVHLHIENAVSKLSDRTNPDYRNSIKESISAVESLARLISMSPDASLGDALKAIDKKIQLHGALKKGFLAIYGYTSDSDGIRHALLDAPTCDSADAKYMLVACSAFVNYLLVKADKAGISI